MKGKSGTCMLILNVFEQSDLDAELVERHSQFYPMVLLSTNDLVIKIIGKWWNRDAVAAPVIEDCPEEAKSNTVAMLQCGDKCKKLDNKSLTLSLTLVMCRSQVSLSLMKGGFLWAMEFFILGVLLWMG